MGRCGGRSWTSTSPRCGRVTKGCVPGTVCRCGASNGGRTAGAHLALVTALRLRDRHAVTDRVIGLNLVNGLFDLSMTPSQRHAGKETLITNADAIRGVLDEFLPGTTAEDRRQPSLS